VRRRAFIAALGSAAAWPLVARAQESAASVIIGILSSAGDFHNSLFNTFREEMRKLGYADGRNVTFEFRSADGDFPRLPTLAIELVGMPVNIILTDGPQAALAAKHATSTIPIVMATVGDPITYGLVDNYARPSGNITGFTLLALELSSKRFELLRDIFPAMGRVGVLWTRVVLQTFSATQEASRRLGLAIEPVQSDSPDTIADAIDQMARRGASALIVLPDALFWNHRKVVIGRAAAHGLPAIYPEREYAEDGGLVAYGPSVPDNFRRAAGYIDRILKGAKPSDLPIQQPTKFELVINLKTAKALGLDVPPTILARTDEVIE
jgi:putative tryptophan/tyrosine transport system substrate-binding protein